MNGGGSNVSLAFEVAVFNHVSALFAIVRLPQTIHRSYGFIKVGLVTDSHPCCCRQRCSRCSIFASSREPAPPTQVAGGFLAQSVAEALWLALALFVLIGVRGASASDLGWPLRRVGYDLSLGFIAILAVIPPVLLFSGLLENGLRSIHSPISGDPLPIFFLALALGTLYRRTHRMMPSLVLHIGLNGSSVLLFYLQSAIGQ